MTKDNPNIDDLLDDGISKSLRELGMAFPSSLSDFKKVLEISDSSNIEQPNYLKDPLEFLNKRSYKIFRISSSDEGSNVDYVQNLAQAAREGNGISEELKLKMAEDKRNSKNNKSSQ